jgi:hypothetical protein
VSILILFGLSSFLTQKLTAAQVLAVASNGKWAMAWTYSLDVKAAAAQAIGKCKAKGGADAKNRLVDLGKWKNDTLVNHSWLGCGFGQRQRLTGSLAGSDFN